uniref:Uncharacterized protein n=1 Tax=Arundo donax TaxID=35708 RepID=A0A0A9A4M7_ARUDO
MRRMPSPNMTADARTARKMAAPALWPSSM